MCRAAIADELAKLVSEHVASELAKLVSGMWCRGGDPHMGGAPPAHVLSEVGVAVLKVRGTETPTQDGA